MDRISASNGVVYYVSPKLRAIGVPHAFSTRLGGVSDGAFASLNLGNPSGVEPQDSWDRIHQNYALLQQEIGCKDHSRYWVHQVHGNAVACVNEQFESGAKADAMMTQDVGRLLSIRTADCVPILIASDDGQTVVAIHAGWRGMVARIVVNAIQTMNIPASKLVAAVGPCIGFDAFEVGPEVLRECDPRFIRTREDGKGYVDLKGSIRQQLLDAGVPAGNLDMSDRCTFAHGDEFFSHRRDNGITGRMASMIAPRQ